jgi:hypothetical protein
MRNIGKQCIIGITLALLVASVSAEDEKPLFIEGYAGQVSHVPGDTLAIHASTTAPKFKLEIARLSNTRDVVLEAVDVVGKEQSIPENASSHGCQWLVTWSTTIPSEWKSGYYEVTLRVSDNGGKYTHRGPRHAESSCFFIVRAAKPGATSRTLIQLSTNTYNAYNNWGGFSLYSYNGRAGVQGHRVSFHRPPSSQFTRWELPLVGWAEANGYVLEYASNNDLEYHPEILEHYNLVLSVGHDEYWSGPMRDRLEEYIGNGGNVAFFSGNTCCWQVRNEDAGAAQVCWKQRYVMDPVFPSGNFQQLTTLWGHHLVDRPENKLTGVGFLFGGYHKSHGQLMDGSGAYTVHRPDHWLFAGTELKRDDSFGGQNTIVGYECDGCDYELRDGLPIPTFRDGTPESFEILASAPAKWHPDDALFYDRFPPDRMGAAMLGVYKRGGTVVTAGSTDWSHGLQGKDPIVQQITRNVLDRLGKR